MSMVYLASYILIDLQRKAGNMNLTSEYIENHMNVLHTPDSWARAVFEMILKKAAFQLQGESKDRVVVPMEVTISAIEPTQCVKICVGDGHGGEVCGHVGIRL